MPGKKILIVEDDPSFVMTLELILGRKGFEICGATAGGKEALEKFNTSHPDIVLLDVNLKEGITGLELAHKIRKKSNVPIIFITGYNDLAIEKQLATVTNSQNLNKPIESEELVQVLENLESNGN